MQANAMASSKSGSSGKEKRLGEIWERFKGKSRPSRLYLSVCSLVALDADSSAQNPKITIEGTLQLCQELDIDPESVSPTIWC